MFDLKKCITFAEIFLKIFNMKKIIILSLVACVVLMGSCKKYELSEDYTVDKALANCQEVTVSGVVKADFDGSDMASTDFVTSGTLVFSVPNTAYGIPATNPEKDKQYFYATIGAGGSYSVKIRVPSHPIMVSVYSNDFKYTYKESGVISYERNYKITTADFSVNPQTSMVKNIDFAPATETTEYPNGVINTSKTFKMSGKFEYVKQNYKKAIIDAFVWSSDDYQADTVAIPSGTNVRAEITLTEYGKFLDPTAPRLTKVVDVKIGASGSYSIDVPMIENGEATVKLFVYANLEYTNKKDNVEHIEIAPSVYGDVVTSTDTEKNTWRYELTVTESVYEINKEVNFVVPKVKKLD